MTTERRGASPRFGPEPCQVAPWWMAQPPAVEVTTSYDPGTRALELTFTQPLERFRTVRVQLLEGIEAFDGAAVTPWTLTFSVGG